MGTRRTAILTGWRTTAIAVGLLIGVTHSAAAQGWPAIFDPGQLLTLNLSMACQCSPTATARSACGSQRR